MKNIRILLLGLLLAVIVSGCGNNATGTKTEEEKLIVGATAGPHEQIMEKVKEVAKKDGLDIELKIFSDYILPNKTLADGELDANSYQHQPFLDQFNKDHDTDLVSVGKTILNPMGFIRKTIKVLMTFQREPSLDYPTIRQTVPGRCLFWKKPATFNWLMMRKRQHH